MRNRTARTSTTTRTPTNRQKRTWPWVKYRKARLPGAIELYTVPSALEQLEKRCFRPAQISMGASGLVEDAVRKVDSSETPSQGVGKVARSLIIDRLLSEDRHLPEGWRVYVLQGVEIVCCGYVTTTSATNISPTCEIVDL